MNLRRFSDFFSICFAFETEAEIRRSVSIPNRSRTADDVTAAFQDPLMGLQVDFPPGVFDIVQQCVKTVYQERPTMEVVLQGLMTGERSVLCAVCCVLCAVSRVL